MNTASPFEQPVTPAAPVVTTVKATPPPPVKPEGNRVTEVLIFVGTVAAAYVLNWKANDLVWSLWISSLSVGYAMIVFTIYSMMTSPDAKINGKPTQSLALSGKLAFGAFMLAFFSVHFGGFHFVHSIFLMLLMPLDGYRASPDDMIDRLLTQDGFAEQFIWSLLVAYWPMVLSTVIASRQYFTSQGNRDMGAMFAPYKSVVKMHVLIFVFAIAAAIKIDNIYLYAVVLAFYFIPIRFAGPAQNKPRMTRPS